MVQLPCSGGPLCWNAVGGGAGREKGVHPGQAPWCDTLLIPVSRRLSSVTGVHLITVNTFVHFGDPLTHLLPPVPRHWVVLLLWWQLAGGARVWRI